VIGIPHKEWGETVAAFVLRGKDADLTEEKLREFLGDKLAKYKIPRTIQFVETLPYTPSGKVMKYKLREEYAK